MEEDDYKAHIWYASYTLPPVHQGLELVLTCLFLVGPDFTRRPVKYERFIRPMGLRYKKAHVTHPELKVTVQLPIISVKKVCPSKTLLLTQCQGLKISDRRCYTEPPKPHVHPTRRAHERHNHRSQCERAGNGDSRWESGLGSMGASGEFSLREVSSEQILIPLATDQQPGNGRLLECSATCMIWDVWQKKKKKGKKSRAFAYSAFSSLDLIAGLHRWRYDTRIKYEMNMKNSRWTRTVSVVPRLHPHFLFHCSGHIDCTSHKWMRINLHRPGQYAQ